MVLAGEEVWLGEEMILAAVIVILKLPVNHVQCAAKNYVDPVICVELSAVKGATNLEQVTAACVIVVEVVVTALKL